MTTVAAADGRTRARSPYGAIWQATVMADYYETLAADYDWLFDDDALASGLAINHPATARLLERTSHASAVLDAACGTGVSAAALARRGYHVWAADGSDAMIQMAAARFRREQLEIPLVRCMGGIFRPSSTSGSPSCSASGTHSCTPPAAMPWSKRSPRYER